MSCAAAARLVEFSSAAPLCQPLSFFLPAFHCLLSLNRVGAGHHYRLTFSATGQHKVTPLAQPQEGMAGIGARDEASLHPARGMPAAFSPQRPPPSSRPSFSAFKSSCLPGCPVFCHQMGGGRLLTPPQRQAQTRPAFTEIAFSSCLVTTTTTPSSSFRSVRGGSSSSHHRRIMPCLSGFSFLH